jgi:hypothetical protein
MPRAVNGRKVCSKCKVEQAATTENFAAHPETRDRLRSYCRVCGREMTKTRYAAVGRKRTLGQEAMYYIKNRERCLARVRQYRAENPEKLQQQRRKYYEKHYDDLAERACVRSRHHLRLGRQIGKVFEMLTADAERVKFATELSFLIGADHFLDGGIAAAERWIGTYVDENSWIVWSRENVKALG